MNLNKEAHTLTLAELKKGEKAVITALLEPKLALKLCEMGCLPGKTLSLVRKAPFNGPYIIQIADYNLSLRKEEAATIQISPI